MIPLLLAQSLTEYGALSSSSSFSASFREVTSNLWDSLRGVDQRTWMIIGGILLVLVFLTRRSGRR